MFWRNNYLNDKTLNEYLNSDDRTNYTYAESLSYTTTQPESVIEQPKLFRHPIHLTSTETNINKDYSMRSNTNSISGTPRQKRIYSTTTNRTLRSKSNVDANDAFVHEVDLDEVDIQKSYHAGTFNTNTNNSGPDDTRPTWTSNDYHLSADEDQVPDTASDSVDQAETFATNNAKVKRVKSSVSNQWFQKNMFGLPNDESDDVQPEFSGAISGDEQYDIAPFQNSNTFQKPKTSRLKLKKSSKSVTASRRWDSMLCSPVAVLSHLLEYVWLVVVTITRIVSRSWSLLNRYSSTPRWYLMPVFLPAALINSCIYCSVYSVDRIFGTSYTRKWMTTTKQTRRPSGTRICSKMLWLLLLVAILSLLMYLLLANRETSPSFSLERVTKSVCNVIGKDCSELDNNWAFGRRLAFCLFSLPASLVMASLDQKSRNSDESLMVTQSNSSDLNDILSKIQSRLKYQEELMSKYNLRMILIENDATKKVSRTNVQETKLSELASEMISVTGKLEQLQTEVQSMTAEKDSMEVSVGNLTDSQQESIRALRIEMDKLRKKSEMDLKSMQNLIEKSDNSVAGSAKETLKLSAVLGQVQDRLDVLMTRLSEVNARTTSLEVSTDKLANNSALLKRDILEEIGREIEEYKRDQSVIRNTMNEQLSRLEEKLSNDLSLLSNKEHLGLLISSYLEKMEMSIKNEIKSTMWTDLKEHVRQLVESSRLQDKEPLLSSSFKGSPSCQCPAFACRCHGSCVRVSRVRDMIASALRLYSADKIGLADFALESAGGTIATTRCTETYTDRAATLTIFGIPLLRLTNSPRTIIQPSINPGECWAMKGSRGSVVVQLSARILVTGVSIDHIPQSISPSGSIDSAIKDFEIKALTTDADQLGESLGNFTFQLGSNAVQTFSVKRPVATNIVEMFVNSNYGNEEYTCIYRLRVHGNLTEL